LTKSTKLGRLSEGAMEAAWLAAVIVIPLFFNVYSIRSFEPDKIALLRSLGFVVLVAWLVKLVEEGGPHWERIPSSDFSWKSILLQPLVAPVLAFTLVFGLATLLSIAPRLSVWGSYQRTQGLYTTLSYLVFFSAMLANLRKGSQIIRLIIAIVLTSLPICIYGFFQYQKIDPIPGWSDPTGRIDANLGNAIFVGAYLVMVFPVTFAIIADAFHIWIRTKGARQIIDSFLCAVFVFFVLFILILQVGALYFTGSRGPWLGWLASLFILWMGLSWIWHARWMAFLGLGLALISGVFLLVLNIPTGPLQSLQSNPVFSRMAHLLDEDSQTARVRILIWEGPSELVVSDKPMEDPTGKRDVFHFIRPIIGYGPETLYLVFNRFYPPDLTQYEHRGALPDRSHNETWDALVMTGVLGLIAYLSVFCSLFYYALKWLGMLPSPKQPTLLFGLCIGGVLISMAVFSVWKGLNFIGIANPFGLVLGFGAYITGMALFGRNCILVPEASASRQILLVGLLGALVAHFVEIHFGIAISATRLYFWVFSALLVLVGNILPLTNEFPRFFAKMPSSQGEKLEHEKAGRYPKKGETRRGQHRKRTSEKISRNQALTDLILSIQSRSSWLLPGIIASLILTVLLITIGFDFINNSYQHNRPVDILLSSFTRLAGNSGSTSYSVVILLLTTWVIGAALLFLGSQMSSTNLERLQFVSLCKSIIFTLCLSLILSLLFFFILAGWQASLTNSSVKSLEQALDLIRHFDQVIIIYFIYLIAVTGVLALALITEWPKQFSRKSILSTMLVICVSVVSFSLIVVFNLRFIQADIAARIAI